MIIYSNVPFPKSALRWKEGLWILFINQKDNGEQPAEKEGSRYSADFTITKDLTAAGAIDAFTRQISDPVTDLAVIDGIEINGTQAIDLPIPLANKVTSSIFPLLPSSGSLKKNELYSYASGLVLVIQDHERTSYTPEQTQGLFSFYRDNATDLEWMTGEKVEKGWKRLFDGKTFECIQAHQTQTGWEPNRTPALWKEVSMVNDIPVWKQPVGSVDAYNKGAKVHFPTLIDPIYESQINANVWSPAVYPAGWKRL